jgi:nitroreductase
MALRATAFFEEMRLRRSVREFSERPVPREIIEQCVRTAGIAPSGANQQPWHFVVVEDPAVKRPIRVRAEQVEREFYSHRAPDEWLRALASLGTGPEKPFLERAPYLAAVFALNVTKSPDGGRVKSYYPMESVGLASGFLIAALHHAGLAALTYTPNPMRFLNEIIDRPETDRPFVLIVAGHPADDAKVPNIERKSLEEISTFV